MTVFRGRGRSLLAFTFVLGSLGACGASPRAPAAAPEVASAASDGAAFVVTARALVTPVAPDDPLGLVWRWDRRGDGGVPVHPRVGDALLELDGAALQQSLRVLVESDGGPTREIALDHDEPWGVHTVLGTTTFVELDAGGVTLHVDGHARRARWAGPAPALGGRVAVALAGRLRARPRGGAWIEDTFTTPPLPFERSAHAPRVAQLVETTRARLDALGQRLAPPPPSASVPATLVLADAGGLRVHATGAGASEWTYELFTARFSPTGALLGVDARTIDTCVLSGTPVATPDGPRAIETLEAGDVVWGWDAARARLVPTAVRGRRTGRAEDIVTLGRLRVTPDHPVLTRRGWLRAGAVTPDDALRGSDGAWHAAPSPQRARVRAAPVHDLVLAGPHAYVAGDVVVHNKFRLWQAFPDDPWFVLIEPPAAMEARPLSDGAPR